MLYKMRLHKSHDPSHDPRIHTRHACGKLLCKDRYADVHAAKSSKVNRIFLSLTPFPRSAPASRALLSSRAECIAIFLSARSKTDQLGPDLQEGLLFSWQMSACTPGVPSQLNRNHCE